MESRRSSQRGWVWLVVVAAVAIAVVLVSARFADGPRGLMTRFTLPAQSALRQVGNELRKATGSVGDLATLRERNQELEQLVAQLTVDNLRLNEVESENSRLRGLLQFARANSTFNYRGTQVVGRIVGKVADGLEERVGQGVEVGRSDVGGEQEREVQLGQRQLVGHPAQLVVLQSSPGPAERGRLGEHLGFTVEQARPDRGGGLDRRDVETGQVRDHPVDHDRAEGDADGVLEAVGGLDQLVDRCLLGDGDQHHPTPARVAEELEHVLGLGVDRPDLDRVGQTARRAEERDRVAGRGGVEEDQVLVPAALELLDLAQHEDVPDARHRGGHDVEQTGRHQPVGDPLQPAVAEVVEERVVGGDRAGPHPGVVGRRGDQLHLVVGEPVGGEHRAHPALALDLDDQGAQPDR